MEGEVVFDARVCVTKWGVGEEEVELEGGLGERGGVCVGRV